MLETGHILSDFYLILRDQEAPKAQLLVDVTVSDVRGKTLSGRPVPRISWRWRCQNLMSGCQGALLEMCVHRSHDDQLCWHRSWRPSVESEPRWLELFQCVRSCRPYKTHFFKETTGVGHTQDSFMVDIHLSVVLKKQWFHTLQNWLWLTGFFYVMITTTVTIFQSSCTSVTLLLHLTFKFFVIFTVKEENKWTSNEIFNNRSYADIFNHWLMKPAVFDFNNSLASITYWLKSFAF